MIYIVIWTNVPETLHSGDKIPEELPRTTADVPLLNSSPRSRNTKGLLENLVPSNATKIKHLLHLTPIPILYKKDFKKMPKWDFDDVYMRSGEAPRQQVCSKSLQNSKDRELQDAVLWNIQLWFYKDLLNVSEWNRLAHFNNPFGFMELNYTGIKRLVDLIPKPKNNQLLQVPNGSTDGCIRCAVVGAGGILYGSKRGKEIDSHDYVFRVNGAVTKGFEEDVGNKTSVYVHTSFSLIQSSLILRNYGFNRAPRDEGIKYVLIPEGLRDFVWLEGLLERKRVTNDEYRGHRPHTYYSDPLREDRFYVLHPDFLRYIRNRFDLQCFPSSMVNMTKEVDVYGFITANHSKYSNYYYDRNTKTSVVFYLNHDYNLEMKTWKKLHNAGIINLYQREEELNQP
ncbi:ST6 (alpha-N-acetyl-neuraminyl-2,3-beta-galactosyl-1, 3)-N-acetylgalactosaminide alpha-2,6-sialyltransferase 1, tandem duplicate 1 [Silurus asotus]|uniref:alpha-N-acetylgalactosaminide alpha-2,6-sialyltransferase n=1 Tax=Silurus asotus TaxID=30991 RepID=A0AAD5FC95_SILAS|nr:ST6 (alpha-N-acetyl-neuraminyl-2,3-beta-galactosyl-1, 3)-N-acetylgalactosaminide alpha-2,6-sialyltransferase 1, tandem duplicate 1 [Silurus asotus]